MTYIPWALSSIRMMEVEEARNELRTAQVEIARLNARCEESPPKDLSDPYPLDGPNVRNQRRWQKLSEWMKTLDVRLTALSETVARNRKYHDALTELVTDLDRNQNSVERRTSQRRCGSDERREDYVGFLRRSSDSRVKIRELGRRHGIDRRQP